jgi:hypothetical protein
MDSGGAGPWSIGDRGHRSGSSEDGWNNAPVCETSPRLRKMREGMAVILTGYGMGRWRGGSCWETVVKKRWRRCSVRAALGRDEKRRGAGEVRWRMAGLSLYVGSEGECSGR